MIVNDLSAINKEIETRERNRKLRKWFPVLLLVSFIWLGFFENYSTMQVELVEYVKYNLLDFDMSTMSTISVIFSGIIDWLWFEVIFYVFKMLLNFSIYSYTVPKSLMENRARFFMIMRNIFLGLFYNMLFFFPYLVNFTLIVRLVVDFSLFAFFFKSATRETVSIMIAPYVLRTYFNTFTFIELIHVIICVVGVL